MTMNRYITVWSLRALLRGRFSYNCRNGNGDKPMYGKASGKVLLILLVCCLLFPITPSSCAQDQPNSLAWIPPELQAIDPEIRSLLDKNNAGCDQLNVNDVIGRAEQAIRIANSRNLVQDRAVAEATLSLGYVFEADFDQAFATLKRALQDAVDSKNQVLEADVLVSLASEAQLKGNTSESRDLLAKALSTSEKSGSLYEKSRALGELGRIDLLSGKRDEAAHSISEALAIDRLNGYRFEAIHLLYEGFSLGLAGKLDQALDSLLQARTKASLIP